MDLKGLEIDEKGLKIVFWEEMWIHVLMLPHIRMFCLFEYI